MISGILIEQFSEWRGLVSSGKAETEIFKNGNTSSEIRYYLLSFTEANRFGETVKSHWGVENSHHWVLDVTFREDDCRVTIDNAQNNFSFVRKIAINLLKAEKSSKVSIPIKQAKASRKTAYLDKILVCGKV